MVRGQHSPVEVLLDWRTYGLKVHRVPKVWAHFSRARRAGNSTPPSTTHHTTNMRSFGTEISGNRRRGGELLPEARAAILAGLENKISAAKLAEQFGVNRRTIYKTRDRYLRTNTTKSSPRSGRPSKLNDASKRYIYMLVRRWPRMTYTALGACINPPISRSTVRRILRKYKLRKWKSRKRIFLNPESAKKRRQFAALWRRNPQLMEVIYSDECSIQRKPNNTVEFVFRYQKEALRQDLVNLMNHGKDISQMIWAAIWRGGRSELVIMERDKLSKKGGYSTNSYLYALDKAFLPIYKPGMIFQQDNARIHTSELAREWFESHGVWVMDWPPHSPDLNPIEHCWNLLKKYLAVLYPNLFIGGTAKIDWRRFHKAIQTAWWSIPQAMIDRLIDSVPRRVEAVYRARGWYTKY